MSDTTNRGWLASILAPFALPTMMTGQTWPATGVVLSSLVLLTGCKVTHAGYESTGYKGSQRRGV